MAVKVGKVEAWEFLAVEPVSGSSRGQKPGQGQGHCEISKPHPERERALVLMLLHFLNISTLISFHHDSPGFISYQQRLLRYGRYP